ncbi:MAG: hypothetical protein LBQ22_02150 [Bacteroidales bacterium]|jgi:hypothetical protein|nr:hypothetical protein [Bacteroidales bacterium]
MKEVVLFVSVSAFSQGTGKRETDDFMGEKVITAWEQLNSAGLSCKNSLNFFSHEF